VRNIVRLEELPLPKSKYLDKWIQHIKEVGNHSISVIHVHPHPRKQFPTNSVTTAKSWYHCGKYS